MDAASQQLNMQRQFLQSAASLRGFIFGLLPDRAAAEDVFQDVFIVASRRAGDFNPEADFLAWVRGIARNKVLEHYRAKKTRPALFDEQVLELLIAQAEQSHEHWEERRAALARCIGKLAPRARQILELRYAERPLPAEEIAQRLAWTTGAVNVALSRARRFLQECTRKAMLAGDAP